MASHRCPRANASWSQVALQPQGPRRAIGYFEALAWRAVRAKGTKKVSSFDLSECAPLPEGPEIVVRRCSHENAHDLGNARRPFSIARSRDDGREENMSRLARRLLRASRSNVVSTLYRSGRSFRCAVSRWIPSFHSGLSSFAGIRRLSVRFASFLLLVTGSPAVPSPWTPFGSSPPAILLL